MCCGKKKKEEGKKTKNENNETSTIGCVQTYCAENRGRGAGRVARRGAAPLVRDAAPFVRRAIYSPFAFRSLFFSHIPDALPLRHAPRSTNLRAYTLRGAVAVNFIWSVRTEKKKNLKKKQNGARANQRGAASSLALIIKKRKTGRRNREQCT